MGFLPSLQLTKPFRICPYPHHASVHSTIISQPSSALPLSKYSVPAKKGSLELQRNCRFNQAMPVAHCNGKHSGEEQNTVAPIFTKVRFSALAAVALGLLCPSDALAETCTDYTGQMFSMPLLFGIALIGAVVRGLLARQRRFELERLNAQLRQINTVLRRQIQIESYAPNLSYAPVGRSLDTETPIDTRRDEMMSKLKEGKKYLRLQSPQKAFEEFKAALEIAESLGDATEAKKAVRGLGASCQRQRKYRDAIKYHSMVLSISEKEKEYSGETEAYGAIADCYAELGDLETAAKYYDTYIERLETD
ncbi:hypothetical protein KI387_021807 [Taxus chinensis]|uniref:Uncharacterized protein n=1 Tax=Taxus chinensis TaxID=29808 RepID=A0AA38GEN4_TAXCH|nr:hypothetical protein KI387_021807 [Taxus chinensis]